MAYLTLTKKPIIYKMFSCLNKECNNSVFRKGLCRQHWRKQSNLLSETAEYLVWLNMKSRCYNPKNNRYHTYGQRGITVCDEWRNSFKTFLADVGTRPTKNHSIDRIDNNGNYEPGNVRWATRHQQCANRTSNNKHVGVYFEHQSQKWIAALQYQGKYVYKRTFKTQEDAVIARKKVEEVYGVV